VHDLIRRHFGDVDTQITLAVERLPNGEQFPELARPEQRSCPIIGAASQNNFQTTIEKDGGTKSGNARSIGSLRERPTTQSDYDLRFGGKRIQHCRLNSSKLGFSLGLEDLPNRLALLLLDGLIEIDEFPAQGSGQQRSYGRLSSPHKADEEDSFLIHANLF